MRIADIFLFLAGNAGAIRRIAGSWWSLLVAALLVLTGGIARNYDHLDLLRNPEWVYGPFVASLITSLLVFGVVYPLLGLRKVTPRGTGYFSFLCIYWMTAPCAWLYAIPVESFTDLVTATKWNIGFLAVVSIWRVFLVTRSLLVLTGAGLPTCLLAVLLPSSAIMCVGSVFKNLSLVGIMGGVRLPPHTELLVDATEWVLMLSFWMAVILFLAMIILAASGGRRVAKRPLPWRAEVAPWAALLAAGVIGAFGLLAVVPVQVRVRRNHQLSVLIGNENFRGAVDYASQFEREDFSAIHYLPPDPYQGPWDSKMRYQKLLSELDGNEPAWLREVWLDQYSETLLSMLYGIDEEDARIVNSFPELRENIREIGDQKSRERLLKSLEEVSKGEEE